ncbi:T3SS (YopN, CesT) and YbjN peptide-binding chaperone 1 [Nocardioides ferulae]|uniref:T3SS (YopN, CesT) and YbjN peptide-binding chaperone 1 n=1 Tax=Nocardioides ferulae TaxID=2340821 RepID=UPI000EB2F561|nr:YbjN domain-containing protein [Nocardioides ferulae]
MASQRDEWDESTESAWRRFRARLADRIAEVGADERVVVGLSPDVDPGVRPLPIVSVELLDADTLRVEAPAVRGFPQEVQRREADRAAVLVVTALREGRGCLHPSFLDADGLEHDSAPWPPAVAGVPARAGDPEPLAVFVDDTDELQERVDAALGLMFSRTVRHDPDGDVPVVCGRSVLYVRVETDEPVVRLYAELVVEVGDLDQAHREVGVLNRRYQHAKFFVRDREVVLEHRLGAQPFAPAQLREAVSQLCDDLDDLAADLADRVAGRRYLDDPPPPAVVADVAVTADDVHPGMVALLELLHEGSVPVPAVADLFEHDRLELIRHLVRVRTDQESCGDHDADVVLRHLRRALRYVVDGHVAPAHVAPRREQQLSLLPEVESDEQLPLG